MKEYNENDAVSAMAGAVALDRRDEDAITEILDLIFDCYDENGLLDLDDEADDIEADAIADYVRKMLRKNPPEVNFTDEEIRAMVEAELDYEESLLD